MQSFSIPSLRNPLYFCSHRAFPLCLSAPSFHTIPNPEPRSPNQTLKLRLLINSDIRLPLLWFEDLGFRGDPARNAKTHAHPKPYLEAKPYKPKHAQQPPITPNEPPSSRHRLDVPSSGLILAACSYEVSAIRGLG